MKRLATIAAAIAAISATPAFAASSASASLGNFQYFLTDLNLDDAFAPWIIFENASNSRVGGGIVDPISSSYPSFSQIGTSDYASVNGSISTALGQAKAEVAGGSVYVGHALQASGYSLGEQVYYFSYAENNSEHKGKYNFTLGPYTQVIFSAPASLQTQTTIGYDGVNDEWAAAQADLQIEELNGSFHAADFVFARASYDNIFNPSNGSYEYYGQNINNSRLLGVTWANSDEVEKIGGLHAFVQAYGLSNVQAVPEPETYAMLLAGLGLIGFTARRRKTA